MKKAHVLAITAVSVLLICDMYAYFLIIKRPPNSISGNDRVQNLSIWIADFMPDLLSPNFDSSSDANRWQEALDDLVAAQLSPPPNSQITHVQMRIWWDLDLGTDSTASDWVNPFLGSSDSGQAPVMEDQQWQRWFFNKNNDLRFGTSAAERIHAAGLRMELVLSGAWNDVISEPAKPPPFFRGKKEVDYPNWMAIRGGEAFLRNYYTNVLRPVAEFLASTPHFVDGDIFGVSLEMNYPEADFTWSHNDSWIRMINGGVNATPYLDDDPLKPGIRKIFADAGKTGVLLTIQHQGWFDDAGLGYNAVKMINPLASISKDKQGISGATYLSIFDFVSVSEWATLVRREAAPPDGTPWTETGRFLFRDGWFNDLTYMRTGATPLPGRNLIEDFATLSAVLNGTKILMNTGYESRHFAGITWPPSGTLDHTAQREAWAGHLLALTNQTWCAGQDLERYTEDKAANPGESRTSWRNALAQSEIIKIIHQIQQR